MSDIDSVIFMPQDDVELLLSLSSAELTELIGHRVVLAMRLREGELVFPEFQFRKGGLCGEHISIFQQFPSQWSGWDITCWFYRFNDYLKSAPRALLEQREFAKVALVVDVETSLLLMNE